MYIENIVKLKNILNLSKKNHKTEILLQQTLKDVHIYCKINNLSGQISGPLIENYIKNKYKMIKNNASLCVGDVTHNKKNIEIKIIDVNDPVFAEAAAKEPELQPTQVSGEVASVEAENVPAAHTVQ